METASSFLSVAIGRVLGAALGGRSDDPELATREMRLSAVVDVIRESAVRSVADIGCGEGDLIAEFAREQHLQRLIGVDLSVRELERAKIRLSRLTMRTDLRERIEFFQSSILYWDERLRGVEALALLEVIEHIDTGRLESLERVVFREIRPKLAIVTTPNSEYNILFPRLPAAHLYAVHLAPIGDVHPNFGGPTQMAVFRCA